jgi:hypothetical protein
MSRPYARECCNEFDTAVKTIYAKRILETPISRRSKQHHEAPQRYTGNLNDRTILSLSPLLDRLLDGSFQEVGRVSGAVPFVISDHQFNKTWITVDGIYPQYSRFVRGVKEPITQRDKRHTKWQEATRKDIERAFGDLKGTWQLLDRPILLMDLEQISLRVTTCIILHNMLVSDRVMGQCGVVYNPVHILQENENEVDHVHQLEDLAAVQGGDPDCAGVSGVGIRRAVRDVVTVDDSSN